MAQNMSSDSFRIQGGNLNLTSGHKSSENFSLDDVVGQTAAAAFTSKGFIINAGFLNSAAGSVFKFTVTPSLVDFGDLSPEMPVEKPVQITIENGDVPGYSITVLEDRPLRTQADAVIPDTVCDEKDTCTVMKAGKWDSFQSYGFGYTVTGVSAVPDFKNGSLYKPFPSSEKNESGSLIMQSTQSKVTDSALMNLKVSISGSQAVGQYRNRLVFTAVAGI